MEHKSRGKDLDKAFQQAKDYFPGLKKHELPKYILVSNFERFRLFDLGTGKTHEFLLRELKKSGQGFLHVREIMRVNVDQFAGTEYVEFQARIAEVAMWLIDRQMNLKVSDEFGQHFVRLPLNASMFGGKITGKKSKSK